MDILAASPQSIRSAAKALIAGQVVVYPTETCYGIACDLTNLNAVKRLFAIKQRKPMQAVSALFASVDDAKNYVEWPPAANELAQKYLPGPLTIILPIKSGAPSLYPLPMTSQGHPERSRGTTHLPRRSPKAKPGSPRTLAIRISSHPIAQSLVLSANRPLSTTSANLHGQPEAYDLPSLLAQFQGQKELPDMILDGGTLPKAPPSTIVEVHENRLQIVRQGGIRIP